MPCSCARSTCASRAGWSSRRHERTRDGPPSSPTRSTRTSRGKRRYSRVAIAYDERATTWRAEDRLGLLLLSAVTSNYFDVLGVRPALGRTFDTARDRDLPSSPVVLSHSLWARHLGSDAAIIGRPVRLGDRLYTVVGDAAGLVHRPPARARSPTCTSTSRRGRTAMAGARTCRTAARAISPCSRGSRPARRTIPRARSAGIERRPPPITTNSE